MRMIDTDRLPVKSWKKTAAMFQDDYTAGAGTDWALKVAMAENRMLWEIISAIENAPTLTQPNEPLTLEELREMDGKPVWVQCLKPNKYVNPPVRWRILEKSIVGTFGVWDGECGLIERDYGTDWLAYRRPPEREK